MQLSSVLSLFIGLSAVASAACKHQDRTSTVHDGSHYVHDGSAKRDQRTWTDPDNLPHFPTLIIKTLIPASPGIVGDLMLDPTDRLRHFWSTCQGFQDIQSSGWCSQSPDGSKNLVARNTSFVVSLPDGFGPKQVRIETTDITTADCCNGFSQVFLSTMRAPQINYGSSFVVKLRMDFISQGISETELSVTATVEWSNRSYIDKTSIEDAVYYGLRRYFREAVAFIEDDIATCRDLYRQADMDVMSPEACIKRGFICYSPRHEGATHEERKSEMHHREVVKPKHRAPDYRKRVEELPTPPETTTQVHEELQVASDHSAPGINIEQALRDLQRSFDDLSRDMRWIEEKALAAEDGIAHLEVETEHLWRALKGGKA